MLSSDQDYIVEKVGVFTPKAKDINELKAGEIGFITTGIKVLSETKVGDTICDSKEVDPLPGFKPSNQWYSVGYSQLIVPNTKN